MRKSLLSLVLSLFAASAMAGNFLVEPYVGYASTTGDVAKVDTKASGIQYGARLGVNYAVVSFGVQYDQIKSTDYKFKNGGDKSEADFTNLGAFVLASLPVVGWRVWGSYFFDAQAEGTKSGGAIADGAKWGGTAVGLGVGYKLPAVPAAINLEYRKATYDKKDNVPAEAKIESWIGTVSFPLDF